MPASQQRLITEQEYLSRERKAHEKNEFHRGRLIAMSGAMREHNVIAHNISRLLGNQLAGRGCDVYQSDMKVRIDSAGRYTYPDVVVVCGPREFADANRDVLLNPTVLVEVLSDSTASYDRGEKAADYRQLESLREFLIVAQDQPVVEHYTRQATNAWTITRVEGTDVVIALAQLPQLLT